MNFTLNKKEIKHFNKVCLIEYEKILKVLVIYLNNIHSRNENVKYWERIIGPWLLDGLQIVLFNDMKINYLIQKDIKEIAILDEKKFYFTSKYSEFLHMIRHSQLFHDQIFSACILYCHKNEFKTKKYKKSFADEKIQKANKVNGYVDILIKIIKYIISRDIASEVVLYNHLFSFKHMVSLFFQSFFKIRLMDFNDKNYTFKISSDKRSAIRKFSTGNSKMDMVMYLCVEILMPTYFLEGYNKASSYAKSKINFNNVPKKIFTDYGFFKNTIFSIWASECNNAGSIIIGAQHGGGYGEFEHKTRTLEEKLVDEFCTFGWKENKKHKQIISPLFKKMPTYKIERRDRILWVTTNDSPLNYRIENNVQGFLMQKYFNHQKRLYKEFHKYTREKILLRIDNREDFGINQEARFKKIDKNIKICGFETNIFDQIKSSKLVVCDYFGSTVFLQSLFLDTPTIVIGSKDLFSIKTSYRKYFKNMKSAGIYYTDYKKGINFIESNIDNIDVWWNENKTQETLLNFKKKFNFYDESEFINSWKNYFLK